MFLVENYIEFDGSKVFIYKREKEEISSWPRWKKLLYRYFWVAINEDSPHDMEGSGNALTKRQARNDALSLLLDKEWDRLPPRMRRENGHRVNYS